MVDNALYVRVAKIGNRIRFRLSADRYEKYRIFGFTDDEDWANGDHMTDTHWLSMLSYATEPCDHAGNGKFAIVRLCE